MYFIADLLNHTKLLSNFAGWTRKAYSKKTDSESYRLMDDFLYNFYLLSQLNQRIIEIYDGIIGEFEETKGKFQLKANKISFKHPDMVMLLNEYDSFFKTLNVLQDNLLHLAKLENQINIKVAYTLDRAIENLEYYGFDNQVRYFIEEYWKQAGIYVVHFQKLADYFPQIIRNSYLIVDPNTELIFEPPDELFEDVTQRKYIPENILHFVVLSYNLFRQLVEDLSIYFGYTEDLEFERFFPRNLEVSKDGLKDKEKRTLAVYYYDFGLHRGMEVMYDKRLNIRFKPFNSSQKRK